MRQLIFDILGEFGLAPDPGSTDADLGDIHAYYHARGGRFDVLTDSAGRIVASVGLYPVDSQTAELRKMYLMSDLRGQGLGKKLLDHAIAAARSLGFGRITLETASVLKDAIALYVRNGFTPYQPCHLASRCDQAYELKL